MAGPFVVCTSMTNEVLVSGDFGPPEVSGPACRMATIGFLIMFALVTAASVDGLSITVKFRFARTGRLDSIASVASSNADRPHPISDAQGDTRRGP